MSKLLETTETPRLAIYARYSSELQSRSSCEDQIVACQRFAERRYGCSAASVFKDEAKSGSTTVGRGGYASLLAAIAQSNGAPPFTVILVEDFSRLSRDLSEINKLGGMAPVWGIEVIDCSTGMDITSDAALYGGVAHQAYLRELKHRVRRGLAGRFERGYHTGSHIFGYRSEPVLDPTRLDRFTRQPVVVGHKLAIHDPQAEVVRRIFTEAADGISAKAITRQLTADGIPTPSSTWKPGPRRAAGWTLNTTISILRNKRYIGEWSYLKTKNVARSGRVVRPCPEETMTQQRPDLALVTPEMFQRVQALLDERTACVRRNAKGQLAGRDPGGPVAAVNPLNGLLVCAGCGGPMSIVKSRQTATGRIDRQCACQRKWSAYGPGPRCPSQGVFRLADLEAALAKALEGYFSDAKLAAQHMKRFLAAMAKERQQITATETKAQADLAAAEQEIARLRTVATGSASGAATVGAWLDEALAKRGQAQAALAAVQEVQQAKAPAMVPPQTVLKGLRAERFADRRAAYRRLIQKVVLTGTWPPGQKRGAIWTAEIFPRPEAGMVGIPTMVKVGRAAKGGDGYHGGDRR
jgi:site-specific DNA recombinase